MGAEDGESDQPVIDLYAQHKIRDAGVDTADLPPIPGATVTEPVPPPGDESGPRRSCSLSTHAVPQPLGSSNSVSGMLDSGRMGGTSSADMLLYSSSLRQLPSVAPGNALVRTADSAYLQPVKASTRNMLPNLEESKKALYKIKQELIVKKHSRLVESNES